MKPVKLHLGCGAKRLAGLGWVNVDLADNTWQLQPDINHDLTKPLPFADDSADEIHSYHVIEHFYRWEIGPILTDWRRVLKPGGTMVLECPCFDKVRAILIRNKGHDINLALLGLYGAQKHCAPAMVHKWCYSWHELESILRFVGFDTVRRSEPQTHRPERDMRFEAVK